MRTAIITGASSGMGGIFAKEIAKRYKNVEEIWIIARREERLLALKEEIGPGKQVVILPLDLSKEEDVKHYGNLLSEKKPDVCILVNSAGYGKTGSFEEIGYEHNRGMVRLNCQALTDMTYLTLPYLRKGARIIQLASSAAFLAQPDFAVYAATKSYVLSLSRALNIELADRKISVTAVCPGPVKTEFFDHVEACAEGRKSDKASGKVKQLKMLVMADPEKVVKKAIKDAGKGKEISVYGPVMQLFSLLCKLVPHGIILKIIS